MRSCGNYEYLSQREALVGDGDVTLPGMCYESHFCCYVGVETSSHQT